MNKNQVILLVVAIAAVVGLYSLPRVVVDNDNEKPAEFLDESAPGGVVDHSSEIPEEIQPKIDYWKSQLIVNQNMQPNNEALDSLMAVFMEINQYDSAAYFAGQFAERFNNIKDWQKAGDAYFEAFTFALDEQKVVLLGRKARGAYEIVLQAEPDNLDVKHNVALTYITGQSPMQGIMMLREIIDEDPKNEKALMSMGRMSIQTGQFENGIERFQSLVEYYPNHIEGNFFLGVCYFEAGQMVKAKAQFEKILTLDAGEQVLTAANEYLERIN
ncbi:tetratricopeptide repeat protein [Roseivirga sp.]|uniref:tetratricopeptide repeat protein n=1 Tax=Roseivirga sp. TaxID=1964215 RepID=UPI003B517306